MAGFSEDTRVKIPALTHLTRIGYTYRSLHSLHLDPETNIDIQTFSQKLREYNKDITDGEIELFIGKIRVMLNNDDLGREFYEKILSNKTYQVIDYDHPELNTWECVTEMPCENGGESFRPDITLLINGLPLVFIEVKMPNNHGGMLQEYHRMNDTRFPNTKFAIPEYQVPPLPEPHAADDLQRQQALRLYDAGAATGSLLRLPRREADGIQCVPRREQRLYPRFPICPAE